MPCNLCGKWNCVCQYSQPKQQQEFTSCFFSREAMKEHSDFHPQPKQEQDEPIAVVTGVYGGRFIVEPTNPAMVLPVNMALYTHPKPREWVDLTEDEMVSIRSRVQEYTPLDSVKYGEAIQRATAQELKEKNSAST